MCICKHHQALHASHIGMFDIYWFFLIIIIQWLNFSLFQHSLTYSNTTAPVCIVLIVHCVGTIQSYIIYSNDLFFNYHNILTLLPPPLPSPLFCISVWECVCVCVRCTFRKKTNHNFSLPEIKKESEKVHKQFFITISLLRTMTYFFGTQLFLNI